LIVALVGYRGCGKTSVARRLAKALDWPLVDADEEIERRAGRSIARIFADDGEAAFRRMEAAWYGELNPADRFVLATGGGAVLAPETRARLKHAAKTVWLRALPETIERRVADDPATPERRPRLTEHDARDEIRQLLAARAPWYAECAAYTLDADERSPQELADSIVQWLRQWPDFG
jgi:shikimate kinase